MNGCWPAAIPPSVVGLEVVAGVDEVEGSASEAPGIEVVSTAETISIKVANAQAEPAASEGPLLPTELAVAAVLVLAAAWWRRWWRLPDDRGPTVSLRGDLALIAFAGMILAGGIGAGLAASGEPESLSRLAWTMGGLAAGQLIAAAPFLWLIRMGGREVRSPAIETASRRVDRTEMSARRALVVGLAFMAIAYPVIATVGQVASWVEASLRGVPPDAVAHDTLRALVEEGGLASAAGLCIAILVVTAIPWCEEFAYRGLLQPTIAKGLGRLAAAGGSAIRAGAWVRWLAIAATSVAFSLMHLTALPDASRGAALATLLAVSIVLGWLYERTGRLAAPVAAHGLFNAINLAIALAPG